MASDDDHDGPIALADYDSRWPIVYAEHAVRIAAALGARVRRLEHVGSTSVPGLCAKPFIDIVLAVPNSADEPTYVPDLERAGYPLRIRELSWHEHRCFSTDDARLHVFTVGCDEIARMLRFRDRLRADPAVRDRYAVVKRELAARTWRHVDDYAQAKSAIIAEIMG